MGIVARQMFNIFQKQFSKYFAKSVYNRLVGGRTVSRRIFVEKASHLLQGVNQPIGLQKNFGYILGITADVRYSTKSKMAAETVIIGISLLIIALESCFSCHKSDVLGQTVNSKWNEIILKRYYRLKIQNGRQKLKNRLLQHIIAKKNVFMPIIWLRRAENSLTLNTDLYTYGISVQKSKMTAKIIRMSISLCIIIPYKIVWMPIIWIWRCSALLLCEVFHQRGKVYVTLSKQIQDGRQKSIKWWYHYA